MKGAGKHPSATRLLVRAYWRKNKVFNLILLCTVAMVTLSSFCVFSLVQGKLNADVKNFVCAAGTTADSYVENGTEDISDEIEELSFASCIGYEKQVGKLFAEGSSFCECVVYEEETFQTMILPALLHVEGAYPQKCEEIMLSTRVLERLGINEPRIGMTIPLEFYWDDFSIGRLEGSQEFVLAGYFEEPKNGVGGFSKAFLAKERLSRAGMTIYPCRILLETDQDYLNGTQVSQQLTSKIRLNENQYIIANDSAGYRAMRASTGSYGMAVVFCVFLFLFLFFILYNLKLVSLESDVREFGLWKALGVTDKEMGRIYKRQAWGIWLVGIGVGAALGSIIVCGVFPRIIGKLYLGGLVESDGALQAGGGLLGWAGVSGQQTVSAFDFRWLLVSIVLTGFAMVVATGVALQKMQKLSLREAVNFTEGKAAKKVNLHKLVEKKNRRNVLSELAWMNALRSKKKFISIVCSLVLGWEIVLCANVISGGIDKMNELKANPDFTIGITQGATIRVITMPWGMGGSGIFSDQGAEGRKFFSDRDVEDLLLRVNVAGEVEKIRGVIPVLDDEGLANLEVLNGYKDAWITIQMFDEEDMGRLLEYAEKSMGKEDLQEVMRTGSGAFILHKNMLNGEEEKAGQKIGTEFYVSELIVGAQTDPEERSTLVNCGYLNVEDEAFPHLGLAWPDDATIWLAVGGETFDMLAERMTVQNFAIRFNVEEGQEPAAREVLKNWVNRANIAFLEMGQPSTLELFSITCNSDAIAENETYIIGSRILMFVVSLFLVFVGIVNYTSMSMGSATARRREFELLGNIGVTKKQVRRMLVVESLIYFGTSSILILTLGNELLFLLKEYLEGKLYYFTFEYPIGAWFGMFLLFGAISVFVPQMLYRSKKPADVDADLAFKKN
jgi:ABC-type antimicrobial peptide transport system permease subunit